MTLLIPPMPTITRQGSRRAAAMLALLGAIACSSGCQLLYDTKVADSQRDCEKLVTQTDVTDCRRRLQAQQEAFRRSQDDKAKADKAAAAPAR